MRKHMLIELVLLAALATSAGCVATATGRVRGGVVVYSDPPPARVVVVDPRPGYLWVDGQWMWVNEQWVWYDGYWEAERPGYVYVAGYWQNGGGRSRVWVAPTWRRGSSGYTRVNARPTVQVNDHSRGRVEVNDHSRGRVEVNDHSRGRVEVNDHSRGRGRR